MRAYALAGLLLATAARAELPAVGVAVLRSAPWCPGDAVREGAGEFEVLLRVAQLQRVHRAVGLVAVGDHNGMLRSGGERALRRIVLSGVVVVKLATAGEVAAAPGELFLAAGQLDAETAALVLTRCLESHGAPPVAADPDHPTARELAAIRTHLDSFQIALTLATRVPGVAQR